MSLKYYSQIFMGVTPLDGNERLQGAFYQGSLKLTPLANLLTIPVDHANFVFSGLLCFLLGQLMRHRFSPTRTSPRCRAGIELVLGVFTIYFCFGNQIRVLLLQSVVAYCLMLFLPKTQVMAIIVTCWSMLYLAAVHLCRLQYDYGGYTLDISGPIMVQTQRLSSLAFNLADGAMLSKASTCRMSSSSPQSPTLTQPALDNQSASSSPIDSTILPTPPLVHSRRSSRSERQSRYLFNMITSPSSMHNPEHESSKSSMIDDLHRRAWSSLKFLLPLMEADTTSLSSGQVSHAITDMPSRTELFAYLLSFHGSSVGPFTFFSEYRDYLRGYGLSNLPPMCQSTLWRLLRQLMLAAVLTTLVQPFVPVGFLVDDEYLSKPLLWQISYATLALFVTRQKYYFAWSLAELNSMSAGLGYHGNCPTTGRPLYSLVRNFDFVHLEAAVGLKQGVDSWNICTTRWFREVFYDRLPTTYNTTVVFLVSAFWHGFYPGYYMMFTTFMLFTFVSRSWRRAMRVHFRRSPLTCRIYDGFTRVLTNLAINYAQVPFHLLDLKRSIVFWLNFYFVPHIGSVLLLGLLPLKSYLLSTAQSSYSRAINSYFVSSSQGVDRTVGG